MRYQRNAMLAGIAALALLAGGSFASAQENQNGQPATGQPQANHEMRMNKQPAADKMSQGAEKQKMGQSTQKTSQNAQVKKMGQTTQEPKSALAATKSKQQASTKNKAISSRRTAEIRQHSHHAMARTTRAHATATAQERTRMAHQHSAMRERRGLEGLQGNAQGMNAQGMNAQGNAHGMGMNVQLSARQRDQIRSTVINAPGAPRVENVQFNVAPGTVIPRGSIHVVPVPRTLVRIEPRWRGFLYFVWMDDVVIVSPRDMRIVAVVPA